MVNDNNCQFDYKINQLLIFINYVWCLNILKYFRIIMKQYQINHKQSQIGKTKVFLRGCAHEPLEDSRNQTVNESALIIQRNWRGYNVRKGKQNYLIPLLSYLAYVLHIP